MTMKKMYILALVFVIPVLVMASIFDAKPTFNFGQVNPLSRAYRLSQQLTSYPGDGGWVPSSRASFFYNLADPSLPDSMQSDMYDTETSEWVIGYMTAHLEYNAAGYIVSNQINMNIMNMYFPVMLGTAEYDAQNRLTNYYYYQSGIMKDNRDWTPVGRFHIIYGANNTFEVYSWNSWEEGRPVEYDHSTFTYDTQGRIIQELGYVSPDSLNWTQDYRQTYVYHPQDTSTGAYFIEYMAHNLPLMYINDNIEFPGMITSSTGEYWQTNAWIPESQSLYEFNAQLQRTHMVDSYWDNAQWIPQHREDYYYDASGNPSYTIKQDSQDGTFYDAERVDYTWETYSATEDPVASPSHLLSLDCYPSPFSTNLNLIAGSKSTSEISFKIYNLKGQLVKTLTSHRDQVVNWDGTDFSGKSTANGMYFIRSEQDGYSRVIKTIKIK